MQRGLPQPGDVVAGKYVIARLLGRGGMGAVYVVEHRVTGKRLALKCLLPEHLEQPEFISRFLREAQAAGRIQHRNVVDVFDVGQDGELLYIVMELLEGKPLSEILREGKLDLEEVLQILLRAMEGVAAAHAVGIVHRDLKPDNIFVCVGQSGRLDDPRVLDFGISKLEDDIAKPLTRSGVMLGTPYYMAFEQINSQRDLDQRVDVYAMGVILYEAMSGQPPYLAESVGALAIRMMTAPPMPLSLLRPELPDGLVHVVMRSIARDRDERFPSMQALVEALKPYASDPTRLLIPQGQGTPLRPSMRTSYTDDATLPAMNQTTPTPLDSSTRLKLHEHDVHDQIVRTPSPPSASKTLLVVGGVSLAAIVLGTALILALRRGDAPSAASQPIDEAPPAAAPADPPPPAEPETHPATAAEPTHSPLVEALDAGPVPLGTPPPAIAAPAAPADAAPSTSTLGPASRRSIARRRLGRGWSQDAEGEPSKDQPTVPPSAPAAAPEPSPTAPSEPAADSSSATPVSPPPSEEAPATAPEPAPPEPAAPAPEAAAPNEEPSVDAPAPSEPPASP